MELNTYTVFQKAKLKKLTKEVYNILIKNSVKYDDIYIINFNISKYHSYNASHELRYPRL